MTAGGGAIPQPQRAIPPDSPDESAEPFVSTGPPRLTPLRELQLLEEHRRGEPKALSELLSSYQRRVYSICCRMIRDREKARDLTQDVLLKVINGLDSYDGRSKLSTWIIRITINTCLSHLQREKVRRSASLDELTSESGRAGELAASLGGQRELSGAEAVEHQQRRVMVEQALDALDADARAIVLLRDLQDLDYQQIAEVLEVPVGTVKSRLFRARSALRQWLEHHQAETDADEHSPTGPAGP